MNAQVFISPWPLEVWGALSQRKPSLKLLFLGYFITAAHVREVLDEVSSEFSIWQMSDAERESTELVSEKGAVHSKLSGVKGKFSSLASLKGSSKSPAKFMSRAQRGTQKWVFQNIRNKNKFISFQSWGWEGALRIWGRYIITPSNAKLLAGN